MARKSHALGSQGVNGWRCVALIAIARQMIRAQHVNGDQEHTGLALLHTTGDKSRQEDHRDCAQHHQQGTESGNNW